MEVCICLFHSCSVTIQSHSAHVSMKTVGFGEMSMEGCFTSDSYSVPGLTRKQRCLENFLKLFLKLFLSCGAVLLY